jgi:hypothetical protein
MGEDEGEGGEKGVVVLLGKGRPLARKGDGILRCVMLMLAWSSYLNKQQLIGRRAAGLFRLSVPPVSCVYVWVVSLPQSLAIVFELA